MTCKRELNNLIDHYGWADFEEALEEIREEDEKESEGK